MIPYYIICEIFLGDRRCLRTDRGHVRAKEDFEKFKAEYYKRFPE